MTLPPEKIGDKGQRYEIRYIESATLTERVFGWTGHLKGAQNLSRACELWYASGRVWIVDRKPQEEEK